MTFVTPTLLAGDKSQATVIAHEVTHSWMGNLVSPENWDHFWLNEGWTRFVETKIMEVHEGKGVAHLKVNEGLKALSDSVKEFERKGEPHYTRLVQDLAGTDPDDAFSSIPYEKGMSFLWYLQDLVGGDEPMGLFIKAYVLAFRRQPLTSEKFKAFFLQYFGENSIPPFLVILSPKKIIFSIFRETRLTFLGARIASANLKFTGLTQNLGQLYGSL